MRRHLIFNVDSFELCARTNLEHALAVLEAKADSTKRAGQLEQHTEHANAAASIRELLRLETGAYFESP